MTFFIVELTCQSSPKVKDAKIGLDLFGTLPLHKNMMLHVKPYSVHNLYMIIHLVYKLLILNLILQAMEAIFTFLIIIYQFKRSN